MLCSGLLPEAHRRRSLRRRGLERSVMCWNALSVSVGLPAEGRARALRLHPRRVGDDIPRRGLYPYFGRVIIYAQEAARDLGVYDLGQWFEQCYRSYSLQVFQ